jgi:hypothetical protein
MQRDQPYLWIERKTETGRRNPSRRSLPTLPKPKRPEDEKRSDNCSHDVAQRDPHCVESGEEFQQPEQETPDQGANQAQPQIPPNTKASALSPDDQPSDAPPDQTNDYPNDKLIE